MSTDSHLGNFEKYHIEESTDVAKNVYTGAKIVPIGVMKVKWSITINNVF